MVTNPEPSERIEFRQHCVYQHRLGKTKHETKRAIQENMPKLYGTITNVVRNMHPAMICMCSVGEASNAFSATQMQEVADQIIAAWKNAATELVDIHVLYEAGFPYMTAYVHGPI